MTPTQLRARIGALSDTGMQREHNEDRCLVQQLGHPPTHEAPPDTVDLNSTPLLLAVCDGMGGAVAGEVASGTAVATLSERASAPPSEAEDPQALEAWLLEGVHEANRRTLARSEEDSSLDGMGSTLTSVLLAGDTLLLAHVGDSRAYHLRGDTLRRISLDQSFVGKLVALGRITEEQARRHQQRNLLLEAIGAGPELEVDQFSLSLQPGDRILLCSDGLSNLVAEEEIRATLGGPEPAPEQCRTLVRMANARGGDDNITVVVAHLS